MPKSRKCAAFSRFGHDVKESRKAMKMTRCELAEAAKINPRYLANIENSGSLPSLPIFYDLVRICRLPVERYFYPDTHRDITVERQRAFTKLGLCDEKYLQLVESVIDGTLTISVEAN
jgi:transcriptional regulator with XRE-family HTH domain